jgi:dihydrofolate synthase/folylpolyglutamate synthase
LLDGAHNPDGAEALRAALAKDFSDAKPALVFGVFRDKDWRRLCRLLVPIAGPVVLTPVHSDRTKAPEELADFCREVNPSASVSVAASLAEALRATEREPFVIITGSLYLVGEALELMGQAAAPATDERALNEWSAKR